MNLSPQNFILFSKSYWDEVPRLRHQVAKLLMTNGKRVLFFEKPDYIFLKKEKNLTADINLIEIKRTRQLIHHQLRVVNFFSNLNASFEKKEIAKEINREKISNCAILNFNYDYFFLRDIFPKNKIITIINDDFVAQSRINSGKHVLKSLEMTCKNSDAIFVVSHPLADQVKNWCQPQLFMPWAPIPYTKPTYEKLRVKILIWAHIDRRFDFKLLSEISNLRPNYEFHIVGPVSPQVQKEVNDLKKRGGKFMFRDYASLSELDFDQYFCSAIPYLKNVPDIEAVTASNKTFQLLSMGMPIVVHGMPFFLDHKAILKSNNIQEFIRGVDFCFSNFKELQPSIKMLVNENQAFNRYNQIDSIFKNN